MSFLALPFALREAQTELSRHFKVDGIPTLVMLDAKNNFAVLNPDGLEPQILNF